MHDGDPGSGRPGRACVGREQFHLLDGALVESGEAFGLGQGLPDQQGIEVFQVGDADELGADGLIADVVFVSWVLVAPRGREGQSCRLGGGNALAMTGGGMPRCREGAFENPVDFLL